MYHIYLYQNIVTNVLEFHTNLKLCPKILKVIIFINILVKQKTYTQSSLNYFV